MKKPKRERVLKRGWAINGPWGNSQKTCFVLRRKQTDFDIPVKLVVDEGRKG